MQRCCSCFRGYQRQFGVKVLKMEDTRKLTIEYNKNQFEIQISAGITIKDLKSLICNKTGVQPHLQTYVNLDLKKKGINDKTKLNRLQWETDFVLIVAGLLEEDVAGPSTLRSPAPDDTPKTPRNFVPGQVRIYHALNEPRRGKKLLVLDIDATIYDCPTKPTVHCEQTVRPYLQAFLTGVYKDFDIALWSATPMYAIEQKAVILGILNRPNYKIMCYMDQCAMISITHKKKMMWVKPLNLIWGRYEQYNKKNTIMCDDRKKNFQMNRKNGLQVLPYRSENHGTDDELLKLMKYLKFIANFSNNFTQMDHSRWREFISQVHNED